MKIKCVTLFFLFCVYKIISQLQQFLTFDLSTISRNIKKYIFQTSCKLLTTSEYLVKLT